MNEEHKYAGVRNSYMELDIPYFWTGTIHNWEHLFTEDEFKWILINSLQWLCNKKLVTIYGFVIMPNHIHLLWEQLQMNGKEYPKNSFCKFTAHQFLIHLRNKDSRLLQKFQLPGERDRNYLFWQRDSLAVELKGREMASQKLTYIHNNPQQDHWNLCNDPASYRFSSARFYQTGEDEFGILTHYMNRF